METVSVYVYEGTVAPPRPGDFFVNEDDGGVTKRKSEVDAIMLRRIVKPAKASTKMGFEPKSVFAKTGEFRSVRSGEHFITDGGFVAIAGKKGWSADGDRDIVVPVFYDE